MVSGVDGFDSTPDSSFLAFEEFCGLDFGGDEGFMSQGFTPSATPVPSRRNTRYSAAAERSIMSGRPTVASSAAEAAAAALEAKAAGAGARGRAGARGGPEFSVGRNGASVSRQRRRSQSRGRKPKRVPTSSMSLADLAGSSSRSRQGRRRSGNMRSNQHRRRR